MRQENPVIPQPPLSLPRKRAWKWIGNAVAILLIATALFVLTQQRETVGSAWTSIQDQTPSVLVAWLAVVIAAVMAQIMLSGVFFSVLIAPYGRVGVLEMQALIAATTMTNYLPFRPGFAGRIAYHRAVNQVELAKLAKLTVQSAVCSASAAGYVLLVVLASMRFNVDVWLPLISSLPLILFGALFFSSSKSRRFALAWLVRLAEALVIAIRYHAVFLLIGQPIDATAAAGFACVSMVASMVPLIGNGLGLREWAIGVLAPVLTAQRMSMGLTADLVHRTVEVLITVPLGLAGAAYLTGRYRKARQKEVAARSEDRPQPH